jgi:hypothetical protein
VLEYHRRVGDHLAVVFEHRHQALAANALHEAAVLGFDPDRLDLEPLVRQGESDAFDIGGVAQTVETHQPTFAR